MNNKLERKKERKKEQMTTEETNKQMKNENNVQSSAGFIPSINID